MSIERRQSPRFPVDVDFCMVNLEKESFLGIIRNISRTGILLDVSMSEDCNRLQCDCKVVIDNVPEKFWCLFESIAGLIVWKDGELCGVHFDDPLSDEKEELLVELEYAEVIAI